MADFHWLDELRELADEITARVERLDEPERERPHLILIQGGRDE